ncbi:DUF4350 domain-containing protein [Promethearchaeum syntrophicum]|uniref:DUF4350 domain-containing protein n=1 Tax=Promethearchaeum syntrophicum TaxID=2594042 RepID=A0A5B9DEB3_9ARCH|nr:DUF4350 domain-containing protein [Candidatus Prometheoarchaeum syntrophicum]QEE17086.1 Oligosaccharyltransferase 48 kDa subunit beta [Candidatus Prometheoarchaeum syntrophicum]
MASWSKRISLLVDTSHINLLTPEDPDFSYFFELLESYGYKVQVTDSKSKINAKTFDKIRTVIIGVPQNSYLLLDEITELLNFVRKGGSLFILHRYGGDFIQKTNLNELTSHFGIYFENSVVKDKENLGKEILPQITSFSSDNMMNDLHKLVFPGTCSLRLAKNAQLLCKSSKESWVEIFNSHKFEWDKYNSNETYSETYPVAAYAIYGQGRVICIGSSDFLTTEPIYGLNSLDNRKFCLNILKWLMNPVSQMEIGDWTLQQLGIISEDLLLLKSEIHQFHELMDLFDKRIRDLEFKIFAEKK